MTFEEKYAAQGRKLDELKAKLDAAVDAGKLAIKERCEKVDTALDEFAAALDAQVAKQGDTMERRVEMLDAQIEKQCEKMDAKLEQGAAKAKAAFTLDKATAEAVANEATRFDDIEQGVAEQIARAKGDVAAAEENARLIRERRDAKCNDLLLRADMKVKAAKEKVAERKEAIDKAAEEQWILDLLDYAAGCYEMAFSWAMEAEYTLMEAASEVNYYYERFGARNNLSQRR